MAKSLIIFLLCLSSVYSDPEMNVESPKDEVAEKLDDTSASVKSKRYSSWPIHPTRCPQHLPHYQQGWNMPIYQKVNLIQPQYVPKPAVTVIKSNPIWNNPWQQNYGYSKPSSGWNKPSYSYAPIYHKPSYQIPIHNDLVKPVVHQPDCPQHGHSHTGIVYAPQHQYHQQPQIVKVVKPQYYRPQPVYQQYHHQPQIVKVVKPVYHPQPIYNHPQPIYHRPQPIYHRPQPIYHHQRPIYTPSFHHPVHHLPHVEPCH